MQNQIPPDIQERVQAQITLGLFQSEHEVLRKAMDALEQLEEEKVLRWHTRNELAIEQSRLGLSAPLDEAAILGRLRERLAKEGITD